MNIKHPSANLIKFKAALRKPHVHWVYWVIILVTHAALVIAITFGEHKLPHSIREHHQTLLLGLTVCAERLIWEWADDLADFITGTIGDAAAATVVEKVASDVAEAM